MMMFVFFILITSVIWGARRRARRAGEAGPRRTADSAMTRRERKLKPRASGSEPMYSIKS